MDEITLDEKKYVSTRRAAEMTGYAKDYVGQLCREGRVPARLVGRNWYVLEAAIQDHRFGVPSEAQKTSTPEPAKSVLPPTWEAPKYEALDQPSLPSINRLKPAADAIAVAKSEPTPVEHMQEAWKSWFNEGFLEVEKKEVPAAPVPAAQEPIPAVAEKTNETAASESVPVSVKAIYHPPFEEHFDMVRASEKSVDAKIEPLVISAEPAEEVREPRRAYSRINPALQLTVIVVALIASAFAVLGSGYMDKIVISVKPLAQLAGVSVYNK